jgi:hypothetical protein
MASVPFTLRVSFLRVLEESNESSASDEPYVLVWLADITKALPSARTSKVGPWEDADEGELLRAVPPTDFLAPLAPVLPELAIGEYVWGMNGKPAKVNGPDDLVILVAACEHGNRNTNQVRQMVNAFMSGALASQLGSGLTRAERVAQLKVQFRDAVNQALVAAPNINNDDRVGPVQELRLTKADLDKVASAGVAKRTLNFDGGSEGNYRVELRLERS